MGMVTAVQWPLGFYTSPNGVRKTDTEGTNPEGKTLTRSEGTAETMANTAIKCETIGKEKKKSII